MLASQGKSEDSSATAAQEQAGGVLVKELVEYFGGQTEGFNGAAIVLHRAAAGVKGIVGAVPCFEGPEEGGALLVGGRVVSKERFPCHVNAVKDSVLIFGEERADFFRGKASEIARASGALDIKVRVKVEALGELVQVVFEAAEVRADDDKPGVFCEDVIASGNDLAVAGVAGLVVKVELRVVSEIAVMRAVRVER